MASRRRLDVSATAGLDDGLGGWLSAGRSEDEAALKEKGFLSKGVGVQQRYRNWRDRFELQGFRGRALDRRSTRKGKNARVTGCRGKRRNGANSSERTFNEGPGNVSELANAE